ncbi:hypothetical protein ACVNNN_13585 [Lysinibacillus fusiformis]|uniref:hypothetical protein n=1 Tax=Lysinibacillus sp. PWR01 TaxID=3342384 RepID=UPI00372D069A
MKKSYHLLIFIGVVMLALYVVNNSEITETIANKNSTQYIVNEDPYKDFRSDNTQTDLENIIKNEADKFMIENFGSYTKTTWFDSVSATSTSINKNGKYFLVQSKDTEHNSQAKQFVQGLMMYFNSKTLDKSYKVDKVILVDQDFNILFEFEIIKW